MGISQGWSQFPENRNNMSPLDLGPPAIEFPCLKTWSLVENRCSPVQSGSMQRMVNQVTSEFVRKSSLESSSQKMDGDHLPEQISETGLSRSSPLNSGDMKLVDSSRRAPADNVGNADLEPRNQAYKRLDDISSVVSWVESDERKDNEVPNAPPTVGAHIPVVEIKNDSCCCIIQ